MGTKSVDTVLVKVMRNSYVRVNDTTLAHSSHVDPPLKQGLIVHQLKPLKHPSSVIHTVSRWLLLQSQAPESLTQILDVFDIACLVKLLACLL